MAVYKNVSELLLLFILQALFLASRMNFSVINSLDSFFFITDPFVRYDYNVNNIVLALIRVAYK